MIFLLLLFSTTEIDKIKGGDLNEWRKISVSDFNWSSCKKLNIDFKFFYDTWMDWWHLKYWMTIAYSSFYLPQVLLEGTARYGYVFTFDTQIREGDPEPSKIFRIGDMYVKIEKPSGAKLQLMESTCKASVDQESKGGRTALMSHVINLYTDTLLIRIISQVDAQVSEVVNEAWDDIISAIPYVGEGIASITDWEVKTEVVYAPFPSGLLPVYFSEYDPIWTGDESFSFPDILTMPIPDAVLDYYQSAPFALPLYIISSIALPAVTHQPITLSSVDCMRIEGSTMYDWIKEHVDISEWLDYFSDAIPEEWSSYVQHYLLGTIDNLLDEYCVGCWGNVFPRTATTMLSSDYQAYALASWRGLSRYFDFCFHDDRENIPYPHLTGWKRLQHLRNEIYYQMWFPKKTGCFKPGAAVFHWEGRSPQPKTTPDGAGFIVWSKYVVKTSIAFKLSFSDSSVIPDSILNDSTWSGE